MPEARSNGQPRTFANRYRVERKIGEGAHASTWQGWDQRLDRPVAIKTLHPRLAGDSVFVQRFQAEAKAAASVRQANVVDVYDFGQEDGTLYIVMQFIDGEDLKQLIQRSAPLPARDSRRIIGNILDGLQAIHNAGIVHRDIKPQNVMIGKDGIARVTDFGVAEVNHTAGLTGEGLTIGTVDYMAPEQAQGLPLTPAADLYATGVMLYEMLTRTLPFQGKNSRETMLQHINGHLTPPSTRLPERGITPALDAVISQSLAKDPKRRFSSARAMKQALGQAFASARSGGGTQPTTVMQTPPVARTQQQETYFPDPAPNTQDAGRGLTSAFRSILIVLFIGMIGVGIWAAWQFLDLDDLSLNVPSFGSQQETPAPTGTTDPNLVAPPDPPGPAQEPPTEPAPIQSQPTEIPPEVPTPTQVPPQGEPPPIEPIEPIDPGGNQTEPTEPEIEPSGYDGRYSIR